MTLFLSGIAKCFVFLNHVFRHHTYSPDGHGKVELEEIGPRFELKPYEIKLGTVEIAEADSEWSLRPYMNSARKRDLI